MKRTILTTAIAALVGGLAFTGTAVADKTLDVDFTRRAPNSTSGSGHTVEAECPADPSGNGWQGTTAKLTIDQKDAESEAKIYVRGAVPNTLFTVWLRVQGAGFGKSPLTGGGATPLAPGSALDSMIDYSPFGIHPAGTANPTNGFTTDANGNADWEIELDFPVIRGAYPFQLATKPTPLGPGIPVAVVNPADGHGGPFMLRVISHCQDGLAHGLDPAQREAWFDWP